MPLLIWEIEDSENETNNELVEIELFPNPVEEFLYIESSILLGNTKLQVMDLTGKLIFETKLNSAFDQEVDLTNLQSGLYLVRLIQNGKELEVKKIRKL